MSGERRDHGEQEVSIRRRKHELFVGDDVPTAPARPFREILQETRAAPAPIWLKAALWAAAIAAALLFAAALFRIINRPNPTPQRRSRPRGSSKSKTPRTTPAAAFGDVAPPIVAAPAPNPTDQEFRG